MYVIIAHMLCYPVPCETSLMVFSLVLELTFIARAAMGSAYTAHFGEFCLGKVLCPINVPCSAGYMDRVF